MAEYGLEEEGFEPGHGRRWQNPLTWSALAALGILVYELTAQPGLGAAVLCLKFGLNDARTAWWLWRIDGNRGRARACFWMYMSYAVGKVTLTATVLLFPIIVLLAIFQAQIGMQIVSALLVSMLTMFLGVFLFIIVAFGAVLIAHRQCVRIWLNSRIQEARNSGSWPGYHAQNLERNRAKGVVSVACLLASITWLMIAMGSTQAVAGMFLGCKGDEPAVLLIGTLFMFIGWAAIGALSNLTEKGNLALIPWDCWGNENWARSGRLPNDGTLPHEPSPLNS